MPDPQPIHARSLQPQDASSAPAAPRRALAAEPDMASLPVEQRALIHRLSQEVAALRQALDQSRHRIAILEVEAAEDPISGLLNQRAFAKEVERAIQFQRRYGTTSSVALITIEGMGLIAAKYGRPASNRVTRMIGDAIRHAIRSSDVAAMISQDQFGVALWNAAACDCDHRLRAIKAAIADIDLLSIGIEDTIACRAITTPMEPADTADSIASRLEIAPGA